ncbi:MAG: hypothetical protein H6705_17470 [Myxococcales bacterium]|nr:hypothetical protein [Myxococcales bacterium]
MPPARRALRRAPRLIDAALIGPARIGAALIGPARIGAALVALALVTGCGGAPPAAGDWADRPGWVDASERGDAAIHAVGSVGFTSAADLRLATADARARAAVAATLTARMTAALDAAGLDPAVRAAADAALEDLGLAGIEIVRRYHALDRDEQYSLARLGAAELDRQLAALDELPAPVRDALRRAGERAMAP